MSAVLEFDPGRLPPDRPPVLLLGGLNLVRALGFAGIPAVVAAIDPSEPALASRYCLGRCLLPPLEDQAGMVDTLARAGRELHEILGRKIPLFYSNDEYLGLLQRHREQFESHYRLLLNDPEIDRALLDKALFEGLARDRGLAVPRTLRWDGSADDTLPRFSGPVLVKPRARRLRRESPALDTLLTKDGKARVFASAEEAMADPLVTQLREHLAIQEYIPGSDSELWSFHGFADENAQLLAWFCGRKIRTYPALTGMSSFLGLVHDEPLERAGRSVVDSVPLKGVFKIDFKRDPRSGRFVVLEINARFNLWHHLAAANGLNLPLIAYRYLMEGVRPGGNSYSERYRWLDLRFDYRAFRELRSRGALTWFGWLRSLLSKPKVYELFSWSDPLPFLRHWAARLAGRARRVLRNFNPGRPWPRRMH